MEPPEVAIKAALDAVAPVFPVDIARGYVSIHDIAEAAVRAAFAAVPDPTELAEKWEEPGFSSRIMEDGYRSYFVYDATDYASQLRAFMRGDNK
jgi:hypothetical protein